MSNDLFVRATRHGWRYPSVKGDLSTEQLWHLPLLHKGVAAITGFDLDNVARAINNELKALGEESFVEKENPNRAVAAAKLEVVKFIIATRQAEAAANQARVAKMQERARIIEALDNRKLAALNTASEDELKKRLVELDAD